ncbi:hypothetical protein GCM10027566_22640 [Arachidicoccus ginsenosidivorans]|uniref:Uncharacterized protein n=1 Tax=Arachidicoccus ginsenosidivorans TaxID=496057 RepID=A0A5B8VLU6_9BACT|nr:WG repeat-containing protein [Arachidicoccus ginsenosidivorans]QEC71208.1 hypothetical protein FSB73_05470 [Arachidicoccus ginsenosidivorans]
MTQEEAFQRIELPEGTDIQEVRRKFAAMHGDYRMRIDNAPTPRLRQMFEQQLEQIKEAYSLLNGSEGVNDTIDLPRTKRVLYEDAARENQSAKVKPDNSSQYSLLDAYDYFGLSPEDDKVTFNRLTKKKLEDLETSLQSQFLAPAKKLFEEELVKATKLNALLVTDRQAKEALAQNIAEKREQERLTREKAEKERLAKEKAAQERMAREKAELQRQARKRAEHERIEKAEAEKAHLAQQKAEKQRDKAANNPCKNAVDAHSANKMKGKFIWIISLVVIVLGVLAFAYFKPKLEEPSTLVVMQQGSLYGYKKDGHIVIEPQFESAAAFNEGQAKVSVHDSVFYIDETGKLTHLIKVNVSAAETESQKLAEKDRTAWEIAAASGSKPAYESYLKLYPEGHYVAEAKIKIAALDKQGSPTKQSKTTEKHSRTKVNMMQYNKDLSWAKKMVAVDGCEGCRANPVCKSQVIERLKRALKNNPNGREAKSLLQCLTQ